MSTASKVAQNKAKHPERYCPTNGCLWRTGGSHCPRHRPAEGPKAHWILKKDGLFVSEILGGPFQFTPNRAEAYKFESLGNAEGWARSRGCEVEIL